MAGIHWTLFRILSVAALLAACSAPATDPPPRSALAPAAGACDNPSTWETGLGGFAGSSVREVSALYIRDTCAGAAQVQGTRLVLDPPAGPDADSRPRLLRCSPAHLYVRQPGPRAGGRGLAAIAPPGWLDIAVRADAEELVVTMSSESVAKNIELYRRARALQARRPGNAR